MPILRTVCFCFCFFITQSIVSQELYFNTLEPIQGLPSSETYHILQDSKGYIWISTDAGICKYDGSKLQVYTIEDGISENVVFNIYEDNHERIWFTTLSGYFFYYQNGLFKQIEANTELKKLCNHNLINAFFIGEKDTLYCAISSVSGILKIPPQNNYKQIIQQKDPYQNFTRFILQNKIKPWECLMGAGNEIYRTDTTNSFFGINKGFNLNFKTKTHSIANAFNGKCDKSENIYIPTGNELTVIRKKSGAIENYYFNQGIGFIHEDREGDLWIGVNKNGGYLYKKGNLKSTPIRFMESYTICDILLDREGSVWATTLDKGVFQCFTKKILDKHLLNEKVVELQIKNNQLLAALSSDKILSFAKNTWFFFDNPVENYSSGFFNSFYLTKSGTYYGTGPDLIYKKFKSSGKVIIQHENHHIAVKKIIPLSGDTIIASSLSSLYIIYQDKVVHQVHLPFRMGCIVKLKNKDILIGSKNNNGVFLLKNKSILPIYKEHPQLKTRINVIKEDEQGNLWIATNEKGLICIDKNNQLIDVNEKDGLVSNKINCLDIDGNGAVWLGTNKGLINLTLNGFKNIAINNFNKSHGLPTLEIAQLIAFDGKIWCGAKEHLFYFQSDQLKLNSTPPFSYLKSVLINDKSYRSSMAPVLKYNENNINFEFENITYKNNKQKEFTYKLEGFDKDWKSSKTGEVQYTNLPYGNYRLVVYALNNDKFKSIQPATFSFEIKKPFWWTWWFIILEIVLLVFVVYSITKIWIDRIKKRESEKTVLHQKVAEFQMTAIRAQMNPHFLFNAMNSIQHYILNNGPKESYNYLSKFSLLIRNVLNNSQKEYITIKMEMDMLRIYMELEQNRFELPFEFLIDIDEEIDIEEYYLPTMLIQPYIENAIWHGLMPKEKECKLTIRLKKVNNELEIVITDNGVGRDASLKNKVNKNHISKGLSLSNQQLDALKIKNEETFFVRIFDLKDENEFPLGTQVLISIPLIEF